MAAEVGDFISQLVATAPPNTDDASEGAAHLRLIKHVLRTTFPAITATVTPSQVDLNQLKDRVLKTAADRDVGISGAETVPTLGGDNIRWLGRHTFRPDSNTNPVIRLQDSAGQNRITLGILSNGNPRLDLRLAENASDPWAVHNASGVLVGKVRVRPDGAGSLQIYGPLGLTGGQPFIEVDSNVLRLFNGAGVAVVTLSANGTVAATEGVTDNGVRVLSRANMHETLNIPIVSSGSDFLRTTVNHGRGGMPVLRQVFARCVVANQGYGVGHEVPIDGQPANLSSGNSHETVTVRFTPTNYTVIQHPNWRLLSNSSDTSFRVRDVGSSWRIGVRAWR